MEDDSVEIILIFLVMNIFWLVVGVAIGLHI